MGGCARAASQKLEDADQIGLEVVARRVDRMAHPGLGRQVGPNFLAMAFITGLASGVQAMSARRLGEGRHEETAVPLNGALLLAAGMAIPASLLLFNVVPYAFPILNPDPAVAEAGVPYLQARLCALLAVGMNFSFRGYWNGVNLSKLYLRTLLLMHSCNIFFNWVFIFETWAHPRWVRRVQGFRVPSQPILAPATTCSWPGTRA